MLGIRSLTTIVLYLFVAWQLSAQEQKTTYTLTDWFPYGWEQDGEPRGFLVELALALDEGTGMDSAIALAPVSRVIHLMKSGQYDLSIIFRGDKLEDKVDHLLSFACIRTVVISLKNKPVRLLEDMNGLRVAFSNSGYFINNQRPDLEIEGVQVSSPAMMFRMLLRGRIQAFVTDEAVLAAYRANLHEDYSLSEDDWSLIAEPYFLDALELTLAVPKSKQIVPMKQRLAGIADNPDVRAKVQSIFNRYGLAQATACLDNRVK